MQGKIQLYVPFPFRIKEKIGQLPIGKRYNLYQRMKAGEYIREELTPDGLHPNDKGHKLVAEEIEKFLESVKAELEVEEKEPVFPKAMTENAYENAKRLTIREISPKLCGFHADTEEKTGHLDHFKNGWIGKKAGDSIHFEVTASCIAVQYRKTIQLPAARAELVLDGDKEKSILWMGISMRTGEIVCTLRKYCTMEKRKFIR